MKHEKTTQELLQLREEVARLREQVARSQDPTSATEEERGRHSQELSRNIAGTVDGRQGSQNELVELERRELEVAALFEGARSLLLSETFEQAARGLFDSCKSITGATAGYVALLSEDGAENELLFLDAGGRPCDVDHNLPMPIRGLREVAYRRGETTFDNAFAESEWMKFMPDGHVSLDNVMFAPIIIDGKAVGLLGLANSLNGFTERDALMASTFGEMTAVALRESRVKEEREHVIGELRKALSEIKTLRKFIPICSSCKRIRDDGGYWQQVEQYISEQTDATFSHSICPECMEKLYPEYCKD